MKVQKGFCVVCGEPYTIDNPKTRHHILPKRFFGGNGGLFKICRNCHNKLENKIPSKKRLQPWQYKQILLNFINKNNPYYPS